MPARQHHDVLIIGGGNAGISLAARLHRYGVKDVALVEPKDQHLYQPLFSHIAGGRAKPSEAIRSQASVTPKGVKWIQERRHWHRRRSQHRHACVRRQVTYDQLVVCPGMQLDWDRIPGLAEAVHSPYGASHYEFELAPKAWTLLSGLKAGTAVFTSPPARSSARVPPRSRCTWPATTGGNRACSTTSGW